MIAIGNGTLTARPSWSACVIRMAVS